MHVAFFSCTQQRSVFRWIETEASYHIICLELLAMFYGLKSYVSELSAVDVKLLMDYTIAKTCINNQDSVRSETCNSIARQIWLWAIERVQYS